MHMRHLTRHNANNGAVLNECDIASFILRKDNISSMQLMISNIQTIVIVVFTVIALHYLYFSGNSDHKHIARDSTALPRQMAASYMLQ